MKKILKDYYNITIYEYEEYNDGIIFYLNGDNYYLCKSYLDNDNLFLLYDFIKKIKLKLHSFVFNKDRCLYSNGYVLLKLNYLICNIEVNDICNFSKIIVKCNDSYLFMDEIWQNKIDYMERQVLELSQNKLINNSFDYFVGIAEIVLKFFRLNYIKERDYLVLSHFNLDNINTIDYYNPLNLCFDNRYKDIIKFIMFNNDDDLLINLIENVDNNVKIYLFSRLVFPFNYFKELENVLLDGKSEKELVNIINSVNEYEKFLGKMELYFGYKIFSWIKKE